MVPFLHTITRNLLNFDENRVLGVPLVEMIRMASLTPARIAGRDKDLGSIEAGKLADLVVLNRDLHVREVYVAGEKV